MSANPAAGRADQGSYTQELSRSLSLGGNILITLSAVTPASSVFIIIPSVLAAVGGASFVAFLASAFVGIFMALLRRARLGVPDRRRGILLRLPSAG